MEDSDALLRNAFGESSSDSDDEQYQRRPLRCETIKSNQSRDGELFRSLFGDIPTFELISEINGLCLCRDFLTSAQQSSLLSAIDEEGWFTDASHNQAMRFGDLPQWATELAEYIRKVVHFSDHTSEGKDALSNDTKIEIFPSDILWREPIFDQLIINVYQPTEGICAHVDLMRFDDGIAIVSLESSCVMHFSRVESKARDGIEQKNRDAHLTKIPVFLTPGSLLLMWGEARYLWKHEINRKPGFQEWEGRDVDQKRRTSITLRKLCKSR